MASTSVLFVCLGNICRSPTAHGVFAHMVEQAGLTGQIQVDSAGTGDWHVGSAPDPRTCAAARERSYDLSMLRARQVDAADFHRFDLILAMDNQNLANLQRMHRQTGGSTPGLFLRDFGHGLGVTEVPDPYYGGADGFDQVLDLIENASRHLLKHLQQTLRS